MPPKILLLLVPLALGCAKPNPLAGRYERWMEMGGHYEMVNDPKASVDIIQLNPDGTFVETKMSRVLMELDAKFTGKYKQTNDRVTLDGTLSYRMDDGYRKESKTIPAKLTLLLQEGMLTMEGDDSTFYRKQGTGPPPDTGLPIEKLEHPDAIALIKKIEAAYLALDSYSDNGTLTSTGTDYLAPQVDFTIRYEKPDHFYLHTKKSKKGRAYGGVTIWMKNGKPCITDSEYGSEFSSLFDSIHMTQATCGESVRQIPGLLQPRDSNLISDLPAGGGDLRILKDESLNGIPCYVIQTEIHNRQASKIWVDKKTLFIRKSYNAQVQTTTQYHPIANPKLTPKDFQP